MSKLQRIPPPPPPPLHIKAAFTISFSFYKHIWPEQTWFTFHDMNQVYEWVDESTPWFDARFGLHVVQAFTMVAPDSRLRRWSQWTDNVEFNRVESAPSEYTVVRDWMTSSLIHSRRYSNVIPARSCFSGMSVGALCLYRGKIVISSHFLKPTQLRDKTSNIRLTDN